MRPRLSTVGWVVVVMLGMAATDGVGLPAADADEIRLENGDRISGKITAVKQTSIVIKTAAAGEVTIERSHVLQVEPPEAVTAKAVAETPPRRWAGELGAGYDLTSGNTKLSTLDGRLAATWTLDPHQVELKADALYGSKDRKMDEQKYYEKAHYAYSVGRERRWNAYAQEEADHDRFADIHGRITPAIGAGYWLTKQERLKLLAETGVGVTYTKFRHAKSTTDLVLAPRAYGEVALGPLTLSEDYEIYPALSDLGQYRWRSESVAEYPLSATLSGRLSFVHERNSQALDEKKKSDWHLLSTLVRKF